MKKLLSAFLILMILFSMSALAEDEDSMGSFESQYGYQIDGEDGGDSGDSMGSFEREYGIQIDGEYGDSMGSFEREYGTQIDGEDSSDSMGSFERQYGYQIDGEDSSDSMGSFERQYGYQIDGEDSSDSMGSFERQYGYPVDPEPSSDNMGSFERQYGYPIDPEPSSDNMGSFERQYGYPIDPESSSDNMGSFERQYGYPIDPERDSDSMGSFERKYGVPITADDYYDDGKGSFERLYGYPITASPRTYTYYYPYTSRTPSYTPYYNTFDIVPANFEAYVKTNGGRLNVRTQPSVNAQVTAKLNNGQRIVVIGICGDWYQISGGSVNGFVMKRYVAAYTSVVPAAPSVPATAKTVTDQFQTMKQIVPAAVTVHPARIGGFVVLRWAPADNEEVIKYLYEGYILTAVAANDEWVQVMDPRTSQVGFIRRTYLSGI